LLLSTDTLATQSVTTLAATYQLRFTGAGTVTLTGTATGTYSAGTHSITCTAGSLTLTVIGSVTNADLLPAADASLPYQRVTTATDYDSDPAKFPLHLSFDGADDSLSTSTINFTATDEMTVIAGVTKLRDAGGLGVLAEFTASASNSGSFLIAAPNGSSPTFGVYSAGSSLALASASGFPAPVKVCLTLRTDISTDTLLMRINGAVSANTTGDQGTGNYSNAAMFIGRRNNASLPFNGRIHQLIVRGAATSGTLLTQAETFVAGKSGVTL
jgi:hypothetical protein